MKLSELRQFYTYCKDNSINYREVLNSLTDDQSSDDFTIDDYRFIHENAIDKIQQDELASDEYILGCFASWFLADFLKTTTEAIEAMQEAEAFEGIGKLVLSTGRMDEFQQKFVSVDGYGHHFNHYDGEEDAVGDYLVFRQN